MGYWQYEDYLGVGAGAVGKLKNTRLYPHTDIEQYIKTPLHVTTEVLENEDIITEKVFLGLRSVVGVEASILSKQQLQKAQILLDEKKLLRKESRFYNPDFLLADEIALYILG
jgi:oxygen-independent coproporphyrinogen-3 oxidase